MSWILARKLLNMKIESKDGIVLGVVDNVEIDPTSWQVKAIKVEASRKIIEKLGLSEPAVTGGRTVYIDTMDVDRVDDENERIHLKIDALDCAKLRWARTTLV